MRALFCLQGCPEWTPACSFQYIITQKPGMQAFHYCWMGCMRCMQGLDMMDICFYGICSSSSGELDRRYTLMDGRGRMRVGMQIHFICAMKLHYLAGLHQNALVDQHGVMWESSNFFRRRDDYLKSSFGCKISDSRLGSEHISTRNADIKKFVRR